MGNAVGTTAAQTPNRSAAYQSGAMEAYYVAEMYQDLHEHESMH